jgi:hypothetical protein
MSTRAQITIEGQCGPTIYLYKHSDGYPEGVLPTLRPFVKFFFKNRGFDPEYFMARLTMAFGADEAQWKAKELAKAKARVAGGDKIAQSTVDFYEGEKNTIGFGLDCGLHGDIEYLYTVNKEGKIKITKGAALHKMIEVAEAEYDANKELA